MSGDLPKGWVETSIEQFTDYVQRGKSPKYTIKSELPVINQKCVRWWGIDYDHVKYVSEDQWPSWSEERFVRDGDILWNSTGTGTIGRAALFQKTGYFKKIVCDSHVTIVRVSNLCSSHYLYWFIRSSRVQDAIMEMQAGSTNQVELARGEILATKVPLPPTAEQHRIVAKIDALFARSSRAREALAAIPALIDRYRQAVLAAAFRGDLTADWREAQRPAAPKIVARNPIDGRAKDLPALPDAWEWRAVGDLADISGGLTKNQKRHQLPRKMPYLRVANVYANELRLDEIAEIGVTPGEAEKLRLKNGDLLIVEGNGSLDQIGRVALWTDEVAGCGHQNHIIRARPLPNIVPKFVLYWLLSPLGRNAIQAVASSSSGLHTLSISKVSGLPIPFCSPDEMQAVVERIEVQLSALDKGGAEYYRASALIDRLDQSILDKAFSGRLVPQDPADEPAAQLLERIRAARAAARNPKRGRRARG